MENKNFDITPSEFIARLRNDLFLNTNATQIHITVDLKMNPNGYLSPKLPQGVRLNLALGRTPEASLRGQKN